MPDFTPIEGPYAEHIGGGATHPVTGGVYFLVTWRENSKGAYWLQVWEDLPPYGDPQLIRKWSADPWGHGTATWLPDGSLYVAAPGNVDATGKVKPAVHIEPGVFKPIPLMDALLDRIAALEASIAALPPTVTGPVIFVPPRSAEAGGRLQLQYAGGAYFFDVWQGKARLVKQETGQAAVVLETWE